MSSLTFPSNLTDWLHERAADVRHAFGGRRPEPRVRAAFEAMMDNPRLREDAAAGLVPVVVRLRVMSGRHAGALETFSVREISVGSSSRCDVILTDAGVQERHLALRWNGDQWVMRDFTTSLEFPLKARSSRPKSSGRYHVACGPVGLQLELGEDSSRKRASPGFDVDPATAKAVAVAVASGIAITAVLIGGVYWQRIFTAPSQVDLMAAGSVELPRAGFTEVKVDPNREGGVALVGFVADEKQAQRLETWQQRSQYKDAKFSVLVVSRLIDRLTQDLSSDDVHVTYVGKGKFRAEGSTRTAAIKQRLREFGQALHGVVTVEDRVAYIDDTKRVGRPRPLTFRIVNVMLGEESYFQTESGARYFVGSVLPDGSAVVSIEADRVLFRQGNTQVVYPLG